MKYGALMEVMKEEVDEKVDAGKQEQTVDYIRDVMTKLKYTVEQAMDLLGLSEDERARINSRL